MARHKTTLDPQSQWARTVDYYLKMRWWDKTPTTLGQLTLMTFRGTHHAACDGDMLIVTRGNGMLKRWGVTGVTSRGHRLNDYHVPLRKGWEFLELPPTFEELEITDTAFGRYVADSRASRRCRVSAYSPATSQSAAGVDVDGVAFGGLFKSARLPRWKRSYARRWYLRFFPNGTVKRAWSEGGRLISGAPPAAVHPDLQEDAARYRLDGSHITFELTDGTGVACYGGEFSRGRLWLTCEHQSNLSYVNYGHPRIPYRFHPLRRELFSPQDDASAPLPSDVY